MRDPPHFCRRGAFEKLADPGDHQPLQKPSACALAYPPPALEELPDTPVFDDPGQRELYDAVLALPQAYRIVLYLFYYEDMEIAAALHISQNAVTTRLTRAREALRRAYQED